MNAPAPHDLTPPRTTDRQQLEHATATAFITNLYNGTPAPSSQQLNNDLYQRTLTQLHPYEDQTLTLLRTHAATIIGTDLLDLLATTPEGQARDLQTVTQYINDVTVVRTTVLNDIQYPIHPLPLMHGLTKYQHLTPNNDEQNSSRRAEEITAIILVTVNFLENSSGIAVDTTTPERSQYIADPAVRELLTTHENPIDAASIITQRGITDREQIDALLGTMKTTITAIQDGVL